jgi:hypothetical protein
MQATPNCRARPTVWARQARNVCIRLGQESAAPLPSRWDAYDWLLRSVGSQIPFRPCNPHLNLLLESTFGIVGIKGYRWSFDVGQSVSYIPKG